MSGQYDCSHWEPLLDAFDCPDPSVKTPRRGVTTTPLQALALMNNSFVQRQAEKLAARVMAETRENLPEAIGLQLRMPERDKKRCCSGSRRAKFANYLNFANDIFIESRKFTGRYPKLPMQSTPYNLNWIAI